MVTQFAEAGVLPAVVWSMETIFVRYSVYRRQSTVYQSDFPLGKLNYFGMEEGCKPIVVTVPSMVCGVWYLQSENRWRLPTVDIHMKEEVSPPWWTVGEGYLTHDPPFDPKPLSERKRMGWTDHVADGALARPT